jgi:hypothetical protein
METTAVRPKGFICTTIISQAPGNPKRMCFQRAKNVLAFMEVSAEHAGIGAACCLETPMGSLFVTQTLDEIAEQMATAEKESE